jgi:hypothetical protein
MIILNIGEKISLYKERLRFNNYQEFGKVVGVSGDWLLALSKKDDIKSFDKENTLKLCNYLKITTDQLIKDDEDIENIKKVEKIDNINKECYDIGIIIDEIKMHLNKDDIKIDGIQLNNKAKQICKDALDVVKIITKQYL